MGSQLSKPSVTTLPAFKDDAQREKLKALDIEYIEPCDDERKIMWEARIPEDWLYVETFNRGDIVDASLVDANFTERVCINWMSKGAYDNKASVRIIDPPRRRVDMKSALVKGKYIYRAPSPLDPFFSAQTEYEMDRKLYAGTPDYEEKTKESFEKVLETYNALPEDLKAKHPTPVSVKDKCDNPLGGALNSLIDNASYAQRAYVDWVDIQ